MKRTLPMMIGLMLALAGCGDGGSGGGGGASPGIALSGTTIATHIVLGADSVTSNTNSISTSRASFPVANATVTVYDVASWRPICSTGAGVTDTGSGKIQIDTACIQDLNVIKVTGGQVNTTPIQGTLHAILTREQLLSGRANITALTAVFYAAHGYMAAANYSVPEIRATLDRAAQAVITQDISQDGLISYDDIVQWQPSNGETPLQKSLTAINNALLQGVTPPLSALPSSSIFSSVNFSSLANDGTVDVAVSGTTAYILNSSRNLYIADVSNKYTPALRGRLDLCSNTPSGQNCNSSYNAITVANQYAIIVGDRLQIVDVSTPSNPIMRGSLPFPGAVPGIAYDVTVIGSIAYVAVAAVAAESQGGLVIVNVANPDNPVVLGQLTVKGRRAYGVRVIGQSAYMANGYDGLQIVDVSNPGAPRQLGTVGFTSAFAQAYDVEVVGSMAYVASGLGGLQGVNIATPSSPSVISVTATTGESRRLAFQNNVLHVADGSGGLLLVDIPSPGVPVLRTRIAANRGVGGALALTISSGTAYVAYGSDGLVLMDATTAKDPAIVSDMPLANATLLAGAGDTLYVGVDNGVNQGLLQVVNIADPLRPVVSKSINVPGFISAMQIAGNIALIANTTWGLQTVDVASGAILSKGTDVSGGPAVGLAVAGSRALLANRDGFVVADISNPSVPSIIGGISTQTDSRNIVVDGSLAYLAQGRDGLGVFDIGNAQSPRLLKNFILGTNAAFAYDLTQRGTLLYVAGGAAGLIIVDVANPAAPRVVVQTNAGNAADGGAQKVKVDGRIAYVANDYTGVSIFDVADPTKPALIGQIRTSGAVSDINFIGGYVYIVDQIGLSVIRSARQLP